MRLARRRDERLTRQRHAATPEQRRDGRTSSCAARAASRESDGISPSTKAKLSAWPTTTARSPTRAIAPACAKTPGADVARREPERAQRTDLRALDDGRGERVTVLITTTSSTSATSASRNAYARRTPALYHSARPRRVSTAHRCSRPSVDWIVATTAGDAPARARGTPA